MPGSRLGERISFARKIRSQTSSLENGHYAGKNVGEVGAHVASAVVMGIVAAGERDADEALDPLGVETFGGHHSSNICIGRAVPTVMEILMQFLARNGRRGKL